MFKKTVRKTIQALKAMDYMTSTSLLHLMQKMPERRSQREIYLCLPTLMMKTDCLRNVEREVAMEILRYSEHEHREAGDVIMRQGDEGNKFYIVIQGSVGVYVKDTFKKSRKRKSIVVRLPKITSDATLHQHPGDTCSENHKLSQDQGTEGCYYCKCHVTEKSIEHAKALEEKYGPKVNILPAGHSFGELALLTTEARNATIIAEEAVDLMVIPRKLFESTIKWHQSKEFDGKRVFVRTHPFFAKWSEFEQEQLVSCLKKHIVSAGQCAFRQGSDVTCLQFLVRGKARLSAVPDLHRKQYPAMFDAAEMSKRHLIHFEHNMTQSLKLPSIPASGNVNVNEISSIKRSSGHEVSDRFIASRRVQLCYVMEGEIIHDIEFLLNLRTSLFRVFCSTECEFYSLDKEQIERFPRSRKSFVLKLLKTRTETKLSSRVSSIPGEKIDILPLLILQLRFVRILNESDDESAWIHRLPLSECLHISGHVFKEYIPKDGSKEKAETKSDVPKYILEGPDYFRKLMRKRQLEREEIRRRYPDQISECQSISNEMKNMILNNVKQRHLVEKIMKRYSMDWTAEESWMAR